MARYEAAFPPSRDPYNQHNSSRDHYSPSSHYESSQPYSSSRSSRTPQSSNSSSKYLSTGAPEPHIRPSRSSYSLRPGQLAEPLYRSTSRSRRWPPAPSVKSVFSSQDEFESSGDSDSRGTVDQESLLEQIINPDRRFVLVPDDESDEKARAQKDALKAEARRRRREKEAQKHQEIPKLNIETDRLFEKRSTPYAFTKPKTKRMTSGDYLQSPESTTPPQRMGTPRTQSARNTSSGLGISDIPTGRQPSRFDSSEDSDLDSRESARRAAAHGRRSARSSAVEQLSLPVRNGRSDTNVAPKSPSLRKTASRASLGLGIGAAAAAVAEKIDSKSSPRPSSPISQPSRRSPRPSSPNTQAPRRDTRSDSYYNNMPPRREATRHSSFSGQESSPRLTPPRASEYGGSSRPNSRPASPSSPYDNYFPESPVDKLDRHGSVPFTSSSKTKQPSKLSSQIRPTPSPDERRAYTKPPPPRSTPYPEQQVGQGGSLPYPDAPTFITMPSEHSFQRTDSFGSSVPMERSGSLASSLSTASNTVRHSSAANHRSSKVTNPKNSYDSVSDSTSRSSVPPPPPKSLPPCPRRKFSNRYDDWWTIESYPEIDVCPSCLDSIIRPSPFRRSFIPARRRPAHIAVRCDFGNPWVRAAWLLTVKHKVEDLSLITGLAQVWEYERPCKGTEHSMGPWWGLVDANFYFIPNFQICGRDKTNVEALFPSLAGAFTKIPSSASQSPQLCSLRLESNRFPTYLNLMDSLHETAIHRHVRNLATASSWDIRPRSLLGSADARPLTDFARTMSMIPECPRNMVDENMVWHYIPDYPDLTVCPECFDAVIRPTVSQAPSLASLFTPTPQAITLTSSTPASSTRSADANSLTCQLYSPRMRDIWAASVDDDDVEYFIRKLQDRRATEVQLNRQRIELVRLMKRTSMDPYTGAGTRETLKDNLARIDKAWEDYE